MKRGSMEFSQVQNDFERYAKGMMLDREHNAPNGYWYCNHEANIAFTWYLKGYAYAKALARMDSLPLGE